MTQPPVKSAQLGAPADNVARRGASWVQTERAAHEAWAKLAVKNPRAAALMHVLVSKMGAGNALVVSQKTLAALMDCHERTVRRCIAELQADRWIQIVQIGQAGSVNAYVVNSAVAWGQSRDQLHTAAFTAVVLANADEQPSGVLDSQPELRKIPLLYPGERQLPAGAGAEPPSQPSIPGLEPDLPALDGDAADRATLEAKGQQRLLD